MLAAAAACAVDGFLVEPHGFRITRRTIPVAGLPREWEGVTIAHITDPHVGRLSAVIRLREIVDMANAVQPDIVALTGDLVNRRETLTAELTRVLSALRPRAGSVAVLGNHDYRAGSDHVTACMESAGIRVLKNQHVVFRRGGRTLCFAGTDDPMFGRPDAAAALSGVAEDTVRILLCHNPDYAEYLPKTARVDLMLCGHTHGGQVKIPLFGPPILPIEHTQYAEGLVSGPACPVFVSRGLGMVTIPLRFNCPPELPVITLAAGSERRTAS